MGGAPGDAVPPAPVRCCVDPRTTFVHPRVGAVVRGRVRGGSVIDALLVSARARSALAR